MKESIIPRKWQLEALNSWEKEFRGVVSVVTGGGKTLFAEMCIESFFKAFPDGKVVIIVPTIALLDQWFISLQDDLGLTDKEISCYSGQEKSAKNGFVNIFVVNTARKINEFGFEDSDIFLIVDECHRTGSEINSFALQIPHKASLGISATPERQYDDGFEKIIAPALGSIIYTYDYTEAYRDAVICKFELLNVRVEFIEQEQAVFDKLTKRIAIENHKLLRDSGSEEKIKRLLQQRASVSSSAVMRIPTALKIAEEQRGHRILLFHERIEAANTIYKSLVERNFSTTIYHSHINPLIRRDNLRLYRRGVFDSIVSCKALDEGLNVPDVNVAIIASSTASSRQRIQRMGRVLRPASGKSEAKIYTIYVTDFEQNRLIDEASSLEGISKISWFTAR